MKTVGFLTPLTVTEMGEGIWQLAKPFYAIVQEDGQRVEIIIPEGFYTDFASVPRLPFAYLLYGGIGNRAGVVHDALYSPWTKIIVRDMDANKTFEVTREWADDVLSAALKACGIGPFARGMMWAGVHSFGWQFYKKPPLIDYDKPESAEIQLTDVTQQPQEKA